ncbi:MAG: hypothetical protein HC772_16265 [Leptolyngbyaceae cyanobacterium CRU_2_3]|nr:hypothetical protein [Leptolyngbyaceae cyanobacterium CRU_2_3]
MVCPIADDQGVLGDLRLFKPSVEAFNELEIRLVQQVANQCAIAIRQARLYQAAQQQVEELEQVSRLKDDFLSTVSHELRTPMASIRMAIQMLEVLWEHPNSVPNSLPKPLDEAEKRTKTARYLQILRNECQREMNLINDLLDLARLDADTEPLMLRSLNPGHWILHVIEPFEELMERQQQQLQIDIPTELPDLTTDFVYLERILSELLNNAYKYTPAGGAIAVSVRATSAALIFSISNASAKIPAKELAHLFDKFYRVASNDPWKHSGTGLGLALVKKRVEQIQSKIEVGGEQGLITFNLHIPWSIKP